MDSMMKYYLYVSDTKVDMLYSQIPQSLLKKIATELRIDLNFGVASVGATVKQNQSEETRYSKLRLVVKYIEVHKPIGWVDAHEAYFKASLPVHWTLLPDKDPKLVYFGGSTARTIFGLVGSAQHVIGNNSTSPTSSSDPFRNPYCYAALERIFETESPSQFANIAGLIASATRIMKGPTQQVEFLAKTLYYEPVQGEGPTRSLIGTPIYVALAD